MLRHRVLLAGFMLLTMFQGAFAEEVSPESLDRARSELRNRIQLGEIAGGAHLVVKDGKVVYFEVAGVSDIESQTPLKPDTIMRIYSMTKPVTSAAAMTLSERGKFQLDDPVAKYIPAFADTRVLVKEGDTYQEAPAERPLTVRDLFRHTSGYSYGEGAPGLEQKYQQAGVVYGPPHGMMPPKMTIEQAANALARLPALHQPGERFTYGFSTDLLGRLIEVWSQKPLDEYMQQALFEPLAMVDTGFQVPEDKRDRFSACHALANGKLAVADKADESPFCRGFEFMSGGGGLVSTMQDYANFCQMVIDGGEFNGQRILQKSTIDQMFTDQLTSVAGDFRFGLGFAIGDVALGSGSQQRKANSYHWGGYANTAFQIVPEAGMIQIFMRQSVPSTHHVANMLFPIINQGVQPQTDEK